MINVPMQPEEIAMIISVLTEGIVIGVKTDRNTVATANNTLWRALKKAGYSWNKDGPPHAVKDN